MVQPAFGSTEVPQSLLDRYNINPELITENSKFYKDFLGNIFKHKAKLLIAKSLGSNFNPDEYMLGFSLQLIISDDLNAFSALHLYADSPELVSMSDLLACRDNIIYRLLYKLQILNATLVSIEDTPENAGRIDALNRVINRVNDYIDVIANPFETPDQIKQSFDEFITLTEDIAAIINSDDYLSVALNSAGNSNIETNLKTLIGAYSK